MTLKLEAKIRILTGKAVNGLRSEGKIPAVLYGHGVTNINLELDYNVFAKVLDEAGENTIIDLAIDGKEPVKILIHDVQLEPVKSRYAHVDLRQIRMDEKINAFVELKFIGESKAVKEFEGVLIHNISELETRCLPDKLIHEIDVDIAKLENIGDVVTVGDLKIPTGVEIVDHEAGDIVATVIKQREEVEEVVAPIEGEAVAEGAEAVTEGAEDKNEGAKEEKK